jgi:hypothetical protein
VRQVTLTMLVVFVLVDCASAQSQTKAGITTAVTVCASGTGEAGAGVANALQTQIRLSGKYGLVQDCGFASHYIYLVYAPMRVNGREMGAAISYTFVTLSLLPITVKDNSGKPVGEIPSEQRNYLTSGVVTEPNGNAHSDTALEILGELDKAIQQQEARWEERSRHYKAY